MIFHATAGWSTFSSAIPDRIAINEDGARSRIDNNPAAAKRICLVTARVQLTREVSSLSEIDGEMELY